MLPEVVNRSNCLPENSKLLILGAGFSGQHIANLAKELGIEVFCSHRKRSTAQSDFVFDSINNIFDPIFVPKEITHLISCIPPAKDGTDPVLSTIDKKLKEMPLQWVGYLSTTGVYGDCNGEWVQESDLAMPVQSRSKRRLECEKAWQKSGLPVQILRLPGIYGPGRSALDNVRKKNCVMIDKPGQVFSRIHIDDIAGAIFHLINLAENGQKPNIVNISDNLPTTNIEVLKHAAALLGIAEPPIEKYEIAAKEMSSIALSFWQENRRVSNNFLCKNLKYQLLHPDYQSGLRDCLIHEQITKGKV